MDGQMMLKGDRLEGIRSTVGAHFTLMRDRTGLMAERTQATGIEWSGDAQALWASGMEEALRALEEKLFRLREFSAAVFAAAEKTAATKKKAALLIDNFVVDLI